MGWKRALRTFIGWLGIAFLTSSSSVNAEPVEIQQGQVTGAGYSFRRGKQCLVVTARHVVPEIGVPVKISDRNGASAMATRSYENQAYDLALVSLPDSATVSCNATWPETLWMAREDSLITGDFRVTRHFANGRVQILRLEYAGGLRHQLELAPKDKLTIRESDSGSFVDIDGRLAGMVQQVDTGSDRVVVLRFDHIDQLIGDRFRNRAAGLQLAYEGVFHGGRVQPEWTVFLESWLTDKLKGPILNVSAAETGPNAASDLTDQVPDSRCRIKVDVIAWEKSQVANPAWANVQSQLQACGKKGFLNELNCGLGRSASTNTPRQAIQHKVTFNAAVTPRDRQSATKLVTRTILPAAGPAQGQTELDVRVLQNAVGPTLKDLLEATSCQ